MLLTFFFTALLAFTQAAPAPTSEQLGIKFDKRGNDLPTITLPYGTWRASKYISDGDIYVFKNIRFAAPPVGNLRWAKPAPPQNVDGVQDGSYGPVCMQAAPAKGLNFLGPGNNSPVGSALNQFLAGIPVALFNSGAEDCLFLDVYVPGKAVRNPGNYKLPVVVWLYGGAYLFGSKDALSDIGFYDGSGFVQQSGGNIIYVAGNYRLGSYGFLAGSSMEYGGTPNAGLWDQRAIFQWVQDHISLVGGDKSQVSAWGESAGAGSIMHHITAQGGTLDPLFKRAVVLSPAFEFLWDRKGAIERVYSNFTALAGCDGQGLDCLRAASADTLDKANKALIAQAPDGAFNLGPTSDGTYVRQLATLELASGNYWHGLDSLIISHTADEAELFVDGHVQTDADFTSFISSVFPPYTQAAGINDAIQSFYPPLSQSKTYATQSDRVKDFVRDSSFTCNARWLTEAFAGKTYNLQYSVTPGWHATDLIPLFALDEYFSIGDFSVPLIPGIGGFAKAYQSYLTSHARSGDPNKYRAIINLPPAITWPQPGSLSDENLSNVLSAWDLGFKKVTDMQMPKSHCDFMRSVAAAITNCGGYAVPGTAQGQSVGRCDGIDGSGNF